MAMNKSRSEKQSIIFTILGELVIKIARPEEDALILKNASYIYVRICMCVLFLNYHCCAKNVRFD